MQPSNRSLELDKKIKQNFKEMKDTASQYIAGLATLEENARGSLQGIFSNKKFVLKWRTELKLN